MEATKDLTSLLQEHGDEIDIELKAACYDISKVFQREQKCH